ncbi:tyrosine-type recombinase/integrase [Desulfotomaculum sp. 1211_IL3151]|uniref:tyrosine-type recombinase/integrase n=1 Tax=Desulfotomaculum sp. 1211_IL3151 TaxID=3084055 RepID=UPI002FD9985D
MKRTIIILLLLFTLTGCKENVKSNEMYFLTSAKEITFEKYSTVMGLPENQILITNDPTEISKIINSILSEKDCDEDYIFARIQKHPGLPEYIKKIEYRMERLLKLAGLDESLTPHSLRHTHTSLLSEAGVGLPEIMERLGHEDDDTTKKVYLHVTKTMRKEAAQKFSKLMSNL